MSSQTRRTFLRNIGIGAVSLGVYPILPNCSKPLQQPNIVLVITDDQGYADLGYHGNQYIKTPHLDKFAAQSIELTQFLVCPVCAPTRASLMTGRYNYRTRIVDTFKGRAMMDPAELTLAEILQTAGYRTGIFGKWHLGDNYPLRAMDQGFEESVVHRGGGLCQPSDISDNTYFDPILIHNGKLEKYHGYCMDIYTSEAIHFIEQHRTESFFVYLSTNTPHVPLQIDESYVVPYRSMGLDEQTAKVYGMITNIDDNFGRLLKRLDELNLTDNTIVIFMTDNGPQLTEGRYTANLRGSKGWVYDGGIRVPCFLRLPQVKGSRTIDRIAAHIDIMPTLLDICGINLPPQIKLDGRSLTPLLHHESVDWQDRTLYFQWHRGDVPQMYRCFAARNQRYKLVQAHDREIEGNIAESEFQFELFDMENDPDEQHDISTAHPDIVEQMKRGYEAWFQDVSGSRGFDPPKIYLGTKHENPVTLTRQDWRGSKRSWRIEEDVGFWEVKVVQSGKYNIVLKFSNPLESDGKVIVQLGDVSLNMPARIGVKDYAFTQVELTATTGQLKTWAEINGKKIGVKYVDVEMYL